MVDIKSWPPVLDTDDMPKRKLTTIYRSPTPEMIAYLDFSVSTTGMLAGIKVRHTRAHTRTKKWSVNCTNENVIFQDFVIIGNRCHTPLRRHFVGV